jgi:tRNA (adenine57-N1/adenine58-N1)-methyltransferase
MLKGSGAFVAICPTMNQLEKLATSLNENDFYDIECTEQIVRTIEAREGKTRHSFRSIGHTTYVAFARKVSSPRAFKNRYQKEDVQLEVPKNN